MSWALSWRADPVARAIADRHYNRQSVGAAQFVPPGKCVVLLTSSNDALWITSWPLAEYVRHDWAGAWVNSCFRKEGDGLASEMITAAVSATLAVWPEPPELGIVTFVDPKKVKPKRTPGYCYLMAGWDHVGFTKGGLWVYQLTPDRMPEPVPAIGTQEVLAA